VLYRAVLDRPLHEHLTEAQVTDAFERGRATMPVGEPSPSGDADPHPMRMPSSGTTASSAPTGGAPRSNRRHVPVCVAVEAREVVVHPTGDPANCAHWACRHVS
jgi:hypothetical protein